MLSYTNETTMKLNNQFTDQLQIPKHKNHKTVWCDVLKTRNFNSPGKILIYIYIYVYIELMYVYIYLKRDKHHSCLLNVY